MQVFATETLNKGRMFVTPSLERTSNKGAPTLAGVTLTNVLAIIHCSQLYVTVVSFRAEI